MKFAWLIATATLVIVPAAHAQPAAAHAFHHGSAAPASATAALTDGEVRKVDQEQGKLTLRHGPIATLDMPAMTMVFRVADPKLLDGLHPGDKVRFAAENRNGAYTVTAIERAR